ncbi:MAG: 30S ribosomal protein S12 methylthiotransferase RimO [Bacteroidales bacterium]|nr:30S ribosomal protein S12 methylthiotransferase RimO [Bacteroidales bacterium]
MLYRKNHIDIISMGCSKNLVDSERLLRRLDSKGYTTAHDPETPEGEYVVVNTCGFINDAKEESIQLILELEELKKEGRIRHLIVMGCLSQRYMDELKAEIPGVDSWYGKFDWKDFIDKLPERSGAEKSPLEWERSLTTPPHSAYMKISEGCDRMCAFCAIPLITGRHKSRPIEEILEETRQLVSEGVKEFNVIAQDLSSYGLDLYGEHRLAEVIDRMADIPGVEWIRLHYAYPADFPMEILEVMARRENVCNYLDIALQHISDKVLANMRRHITKDETIALLEEIRRRVPGIRIRTTLMTGFPGEDEGAFEELKEFVRTQRFDRMGAFAYSEEDDTYAARHLKDCIPEEEKQRRLDEIMEMQEEISLDLNSRLVGETVRVLIERFEGDRAIGRTQWDSPEVDPEIFVTIPEDLELNTGDFIDVKVTGAYPFELEGEPVISHS